MNSDQTVDSSAEDKSAIQSILDAQAAAWNAGDGAAWGVAYAEDADFVNILGQVMQGRTAIIDRHAKIFAGPFKGSTAVISIRRFTRISPDLAVIDAIYKVSGYQFLPPGIVPTTPGTLITLMKYVAARHGNDWRFLAAQNTASMPAA